MPIPAETIALIRRLREHGVMLKDIAAATGTTLNAVNKLCRRHSIKKPETSETDQDEIDVPFDPPKLLTQPEIDKIYTQFGYYRSLRFAQMSQPAFDLKGFWE